MSIRNELGLSVDTITFPRFRELKGKYQLTNDDLASIMGFARRQTVTSKLDKGTFLPVEMIKFVRFVNSKGENETIHTVFGQWAFFS